MAQGNFKLKKNPLKKAKPKRGDQQKLRKGCAPLARAPRAAHALPSQPHACSGFDIKPKGQGRVASDRAASDRITKSIVQRIEQTSAHCKRPARVPTL